MTSSSSTGNQHTIADLRAEGVQAARVWCLNRACQHYAVAPFEAIGAPSGFTFIDLPKTRRFVCRECDARDVYLMPECRCIERVARDAQREAEGGGRGWRLAPTRGIEVIRQADGGNTLVLTRWGLAPS